MTLKQEAKVWGRSPSRLVWMDRETKLVASAKTLARESVPYGGWV